MDGLGERCRREADGASLARLFGDAVVFLGAGASGCFPHAGDVSNLAARHEVQNSIRLPDQITIYGGEWCVCVCVRVCACVC